MRDTDDPAGARAILDAIVEAVDRAHLAVHGVHVSSGDEDAEHLWGADARRNVYSVAKGVCAIALGIAHEEGALTPETTVGDVWPSMAFGRGAERITAADLLRMRSGIDFVWFGDEPVPWPDLAQEMLRRPTRGAGQVFQYSDASTYVVMRMLGARVGDVRDWLMPRLFDPLGIPDPVWHRCPRGWILGGTGLELRTGELARLSRVLRDRGRWHSKRIVSGGWVDGMHETWMSTGEAAPVDAYGLSTWRGPGRRWRLAGRHGQLIVIDEAIDTAVTVTANELGQPELILRIAADALSSASERP